MGSVLIPTWTLGLNIKIHYNFVPRRRVDTTEGIGGGGGGGECHVGEWVRWSQLWLPPNQGVKGDPPPSFFFHKGKGRGKERQKDALISCHGAPLHPSHWQFDMPASIMALMMITDDDAFSHFYSFISLSPPPSSSSKKSVQLVNLGSQR